MGDRNGPPRQIRHAAAQLLLKGYDNVVLAGKNVGSSALAFGSARIQPNTSAAAESIGVLLGELRGTGYKLTNVPPQEMARVQQLLATKHHLKVTGITGENKLAGWTADELRKLDSGEINFTTYKHK
ncbi:FAD-dependent oxidoreductase [Gordoniibacillus kamchatkensis]|uniref:FAD-dependent oxidoreductase n=1 Tax=Gordoniibacillus kamchatkensis TaxID=1590651 RepID=UPI001E4EF1F7|nr:FAD-dependent oxidoreductase [Paenibacillus sp. VKM B-2647]